MAGSKADSSEKIHPEQSVPSIGSDEESFVVLWKDTDCKSVEDISSGSFGSSFVKATKSFISKKPSKQLTKTNQSSDNDPSYSNETKVVEMSEIDQFTIMPMMPFDEGEIDTSGIISITTLPTDLTPEQVQKKISDLIEENTRLKYIIVQNNATMKSQCQKIVAWQEDVQKVHEGHKKKIIEAKEFIEKLKMDKYNLTRELEQMKEYNNSQKEVLREKEELIQEKLHGANEVDVKVKDLEQAMNNLTVENTVLNAEIEERDKEVTKLQTSLHGSRSEVEEAKAELVRNKSLYENELKSLNLIIDTLKSDEYSFSGSSQYVANIPNQSTSTQVGFTQITDNRTATYAQMENLNKEILELRSKLDNSQTQMDEISVLKTQLQLYKADFEAERRAKEQLQTHRNKLLEDIKKLQEDNHKFQETMNTIREKYVIIPKTQQHGHPDEECCIQ